MRMLPLGFGGGPSKKIMPIFVEFAMNFLKRPIRDGIQQTASF
jgi:hypothetical protein